MGEAYPVLLLLATNFVYGAYHAIQPGHGKTIAAAYIVGARGRPVDAWILGIFVTLSHTSGIVLVGVLASIGLPGLESHRIETWLALATGVLVVVLGLWTLWTQRALFELAGWNLRGSQPPPPSAGESGPRRYQAHDHHHGHVHDHFHAHPENVVHGHAHSYEPHQHTHEGEPAGYHSHGWGLKHTHDMKLVTTNRPSLWVLIWLGIAGGLLPDPIALALLTSALVSGKVMLGLAGVLSFSLGFAAVLVVVGAIAAAAGKRILDWLAGASAARLQICTSLLIVAVGIVLTVLALQKLTRLA